jgi:hypothetical protein
MNILNKILYLLKDKAFWANLVVFLFLMLVTGWILLISLKLITKWGQSADVPNILNKKFDVAIEKIEGSYANVVGLPTHKLYKELMNF